MSWYRIQAAHRDTADLLNPENWQSRQFSGEKWITCGACGGARCKHCDDAGEIEDVRCGVSTCGSVEDLIAYFRIVGGDLDDCVLVELDGRRAADEDHDAVHGAVLVEPTSIRSVTPLDQKIIDAILA